MKKMLVSGDHIASDTGRRWSILWDTTLRPEGRWSTAEAKTETEALERAAHFRKLGFAVHAINDPSGELVMDAAAIQARLIKPPEEPLRREAPRPVPHADQSSLDFLKGLSEQFGATPGQSLPTESIRTRLLLQGMSASEFERILSIAQGQGWVEVTAGSLMLTQTGHGVATA
jgi:hypothetical protein